MAATYLHNEKNKSKLRGLHPDLVRVVNRFDQLYDEPYLVIEGMRSIQRQRELVKRGASKTMNSRHLTGHAVDIAPMEDGAPSWDWPLYYKLAKVMKEAAKIEGVPIEWGGDWKTFKDGPHWQLPFRQYPKTEKFLAEIENAPLYEGETEKGAAGKAVAFASTGAATGAALAAEPLGKAADLVSAQQAELSSGDWVRMALAAVVIGLGLWAAFKKAAS